MRKAGLDPAGVIVRGVSILKIKYDTQQAITHRGQHEIDRWEKQVERDLQRMIQMWSELRLPYSLPHQSEWLFW